MRWKTRLILGMTLAMTIGWVGGDAAAGTDEFPIYTGDQINALFDHLPLEGVGETESPPSITGSPQTDARIRRIAGERGYVRRPSAETLVGVDGRRLHPRAARAWENLQAEAHAAGFDISLLSGYRSVDQQRSMFLRSLSSYTDSALDRHMQVVAPPGYSKHHTGYALDIAQSGWRGRFGSSPAWQWLTADNYANATRFGFIPSYPEDASSQGPDPEPWEWTYVGRDAIRCGAFHLGLSGGTDAANPSGTVHDLATCGDLPLTRGAAVYYLADLFGWEPGPDRFVDDAGTVYESAIDAAAAAGVAGGCDRDRFCPWAPLTRAQTAAFLVAALDLEPADEDYFTDDESTPLEASINSLAAAGITHGCNPPANDRFCPDQPLARSQLLALLDNAMPLPPPYRGTFADDGSIFQSDIEWIAARGVTNGCQRELFCPRRVVTGGEMAAFLARAFHLMAASGSVVDTGVSPFTDEIAALAATGITAGCNPPPNDRLCPGQEVTRAETGAFLARALGLGPERGRFADTAGHVVDGEIGALDAADISRGCNPPVGDRFCPEESVTREQMATFLRRAAKSEVLD